MTIKNKIENRRAESAHGEGIAAEYTFGEIYRESAARFGAGTSAVEWDAGNFLVTYFELKKSGKRRIYAFIKRAFDILSSLTFLIVFSWLYLLIAVLVKASDGGKVLYFHERVGKNGKTIRIPKFRTMKQNADKLEDMLTPEQLEQYKREYKIDNDPRITRIGAFLRRTSLDELPQIWSIFIGQLSVVGPRPLMKSEVEEKYGAERDRLLSVKPGLIGYWAANGRSNCTYESGQRQKMELYYVDNRSLWLDTKIICKTVVGVLRKEGAR